MNYSEIRKNARSALKGKWGSAVVAYLIVCLLPMVAGWIFEWSDFLSLLGSLAVMLITGPLMYSFNKMMLTANRGGKIEASDAFVGFNEFSRTMMAGVDIYLRTFLWTLLFVIPGIVASYSYAMTYYVMVDNKSISSTEAIAKSKALMRGHRLELFFLDLSFIGWMLLCVLTLGIGSFWLGPYMEASKANFYQKLINENYGENLNETNDKKIVREEEVSPFCEDNDATILYNLKCPCCGARETHSATFMKCPYCDAVMKEDK